MLCPSIRRASMVKASSHTAALSHKAPCSSCSKQNALQACHATNIVCHGCGSKGHWSHTPSALLVLLYVDPARGMATSQSSAALKQNLKYQWKAEAYPHRDLFTVPRSSTQLLSTGSKLHPKNRNGLPTFAKAFTNYSSHNRQW